MKYLHVFTLPLEVGIKRLVVQWLLQRICLQTDLVKFRLVVKPKEHLVSNALYSSIHAFDVRLPIPLQKFKYFIISF
jgi:hypothetical protein